MYVTAGRSLICFWMPLSGETIIADILLRVHYQCGLSVVKLKLTDNEQRHLTKLFATVESYNLDDRSVLFVEKV